MNRIRWALFGVLIAIPLGLLAQSGGGTIVNQSGSITGVTLATGCTTNPALTVTYTRVGKMVTMGIAGFSCAVSGTPGSMISSASVPANLIPPTTAYVPCIFDNNSTNVAGACQISSTGQIVMTSILGTMVGTIGVATIVSASTMRFTYSLN